MNIIKLTDEELCMLEQLTYLSEKVSQAASSKDDTIEFYRINKNDTEKTISEILIDFTPEALDNLRTHTEAIDKSLISGAEWANIIEYLQKSRLAKSHA